jgi:hypothetical protein
MDHEQYETYKTELLNQDNTFSRIASYMKPFIPKKLYRYSNFNNEYWEKMLFGGEVYLTKASKFNDPFDCVINMNPNKLFKSGKFRESLLLKFPILNEINLNKLDEEEIWTIVEGLQDDLRAACFSETWKSILMWSHYANCHTGFCLEYDTEEMKDFKRSRLFPALYLEDQIDITDYVMNLTLNTVLITMLSKAKEWEYEKEWRLLFTKEYTKEHLYFRREIKSIILGVKYDGKHMNKIIDWAIKNKKEVYKAKKMLGKYEIDREKIL